MTKSAGKYDAILPTLPKFQGDDPSYQQRIDVFKATVDTTDATTLARTYAELRYKKDLINTTLSDINLRLAAYEQLLATSQEIQSAGWGDYGVKENALRLDSGETIRVQSEPYGQVKDKEAFRLWCIRAGYERQLQLWPSAMNAIVKERLVAGEPPPDGCEAYALTKIVFVKGAE